MALIWLKHLRVPLREANSLKTWFSFSHDLVQSTVVKCTLFSVSELQCKIQSTVGTDLSKSCTVYNCSDISLIWLCYLLVWPHPKADNTQISASCTSHLVGWNPIHRNTQSSNYLSLVVSFGFHHVFLCWQNCIKKCQFENSTEILKFQLEVIWQIILISCLCNEISLQSCCVKCITWRVI